VIACPIAEADTALAYERLLDNRVDESTVLDLRVPVLGGEIPFVYRKHRAVGDRFGNSNLWVGLATAEEVFSGDERKLLLAFCRAMKLDLGELDVLRDAGNGRIYVVDVNPTAWGPPRPLRTAHALRAVRAYAAAFTRLVERTVAGGEGDAVHRPGTEA
jgi:RimK-like ATP-grasp domain